MAVSASKITDVAVVGFGTMGEGIAQNFAEAGFRARAIDRDRQVLDRGIEQMAANLRTAKTHGLLRDQPEAVLSRVACFTWDDLEDAVADCQLVVETVPEVLSIKREVFSRLDTLPGDILLATNTSSMTVSQITEGMATSDRVVGLHYFNPAHLIPAVEIHKAPGTAAWAIEAAQGVMTRAGKVPVLVRKEIPGFIINRLTGALEREIDHLLDEGVTTPDELDTAIKASIGLRLACIGPMEAEDFIGLDTAERVSNALFKVLSNATKASPGLAQKVQRGELGLKSGKGWYDYSNTSRREILRVRNEKLIRQLHIYRDHK